MRVAVVMGSLSDLPKLEAMIEILKITGFNPNQKTIDKIYNTPNINITLYKEDPV